MLYNADGTLVSSRILGDETRKCAYNDGKNFINAIEETYSSGKKFYSVEKGTWAGGSENYECESAFSAIRVWVNLVGAIRQI